MGETSNGQNVHLLFQPTLYLMPHDGFRNHSLVII